MASVPLGDVQGRAHVGERGAPLVSDAVRNLVKLQQGVSGGRREREQAQHQHRDRLQQQVHRASHRPRDALMVRVTLALPRPSARRLRHALMLHASCVLEPHRERDRVGDHDRSSFETDALKSSRSLPPQPLRHHRGGTQNPGAGRAPRCARCTRRAGEASCFSLLQSAQSQAEARLVREKKQKAERWVSTVVWRTFCRILVAGFGGGDSLVRQDKRCGHARVLAAAAGAAWPETLGRPYRPDA